MTKLVHSRYFGWCISEKRSGPLSQIDNNLRPKFNRFCNMRGQGEFASSTNLHVCSGITRVYSRQYGNSFQPFLEQKL